MKSKLSIISLIFISLIAFSSELSALSYSVNKNFSNYNLIYATGRIRHGDLYRLQNKLRRVSKRKQTIVVFNSAGGELNEGLEIGKFLKRRHIGTAVKQNGICASSCALAFLGGRDKYGKKLMILPDSAKLGYHSFYYNQNFVQPSTMQRDLANVLDYASIVGTPSSLLVKMFKTKSSNMYWVREQDRALLGLKRGLENTTTRLYNTTIKTSSSHVNSSQYSYLTQTSYVKNYFNKINSVITASRGSSFNNVAYNDISYKDWLSSTLRYVHLRSIKLVSVNQVEAEVVYSMKNGKRICSKNIYDLTQNYSGWKILSKQHRGCNYKSRRELKKLAAYLP